MSEHRAKRSGNEPAPTAANEPRTPRAVELGRGRARIAWGWVDTALQTLRGDRARYGTLARKLPSLLQTSGLGQTLAFLFAKAGGNARKAEGLLLEQMSLHLRQRLNRPLAAGAVRELDHGMQLVLDLTPSDYRRATAEAFAIAEWLKRFAEGRIEAEEGT
ncbi:hypothetical protein BE21_58700 [Sorangium cellulosum]|uniref:CRISPR type III-B/RAMP module-associated protein Cmr5 n=1 Tax=Sorangium cellulosum TaxID=56 RepID=A0A150U1M3_SORCE|nr:hypothetical protein BE21_58700 [Sorangium cellulosum]